LSLELVAFASSTALGILFLDLWNGLELARPRTHGFVYEYQTLISALIAIVAAGVALLVPFVARWSDKIHVLKAFRSTCRELADNSYFVYELVMDESVATVDIIGHIADTKSAVQFVDVIAYLEDRDKEHLRKLKQCLRFIDYQMGVKTGAASTFSPLARYVGGSTEIINLYLYAGIFAKHLAGSTTEQDAKYFPAILARIEGSSAGQ
jgi:hypothetical protein